jgi:preprotein translocase subunit SecG
MPGWMKWGVALLIGAGIIVLGWRLADSRWFFWLLPTFFIANCLVLIVVVLLQSGKAADLAGAFGGAGSQTAFGPRGAANVLSKATTWCAVMFMLCAFAMVLRTDKVVGQGSSILEKVSQPTPKSTPAPATSLPTHGTTPAATPSTPPAPAPSSSQPNTQPASQPPAAPATTPATTPGAQQPKTKPASQPPAASQPPPAQQKKP